MKKILSIALAVLFATVGVAMATDFTMSGAYYVRGQAHSNFYPILPDGTLGDRDFYGIYDHDFDLTGVWQIADTTKVTGTFEGRDESWTGNDAFDLDRVWADHTFGNGGTISVGIMSGGAWATSFGDSEDASYRVKWTQPVSFGVVVGLVQKLNETTTANDDNDVYALGMITKAGMINIKPLLILTHLKAADIKKYSLDLGIDGAFGDAFSFESEVNIDHYDAATDHTQWGAYAKLSFAAGPVTLGILGAYGSENDDGSYEPGADFCVGGATFLGCDWDVDDADADNEWDADGLNGLRAVAVTLDYAASEQLSAWAYAGYAMTDVVPTGAPAGTDVSMWEISGGVSYAITDAVTYSVSGAYGVLDIKDVDTDPAVTLAHKLAFSF